VRLPEPQDPRPILVVAAATAAGAGLRVVRHGKALIGVGSRGGVGRGEGSECVGRIERRGDFIAGGRPGSARR
jgi:hypothetical protein